MSFGGRLRRRPCLYSLPGICEKFHNHSVFSRLRERSKEVSDKGVTRIPVNSGRSSIIAVSETSFAAWMATLHGVANCSQTGIRGRRKESLHIQSPESRACVLAGPNRRRSSLQSCRVLTSAAWIEEHCGRSNPCSSHPGGQRSGSSLTSFFLQEKEKNRLNRHSAQSRSYVKFGKGGGGIKASNDELDADGNQKVQQMLVDMLRLEIGRVRMTDFVDERSQHMREIAKGHTVELNRIARRTMKRVDGLGNKMLRELDAGASEIERELEIARVELEAKERDFEEFEARALYSRNEGLFFKNLYPRPKSLPFSTSTAQAVPRVQVQVEVSPTDSDEKALSAYRYVLYSGLSMVMVSLTWSASSALLAGVAMRSSKLAAYVIIISLLLLQIKFEKAIVGQDEQTDSADGN